MSQNQNKTFSATAPQAGMFPATDTIVRAGLNGAAITGAWTAINEVIRLRNNEITADEALRSTGNSAAIGAGAGAVATIASHVARNAPVLGLALLAAGVFFFANRAKKAAEAPAEGGAK